MMLTVVFNQTRLAVNETSLQDREPSPLAYLGDLSAALSPVSVGPPEAPWRTVEEMEENLWTGVMTEMTMMTCGPG